MKNSELLRRSLLGGIKCHGFGGNSSGKNPEGKNNVSNYGALFDELQ